MRIFCTAAVLSVWALGLPALAFGAAYDAPTIQFLISGKAKAAVQITAGPSGAPAGFTFKWMLESDYIANGNQFYPAPNAVQGEGKFFGQPTLNTFRGTVLDFVLQPEQSILVEIGDLFDETGVTVTAPTEELLSDQTYVMAAVANADLVFDESPLSNIIVGDTQFEGNCTLTQGYWKTHDEVWPVDGLWLGTNYYTKSQLLAILRRAVRGNGLSSLAHQLIAVKLNIESGADPSVVETTLLTAETLVGSLLIPPVGMDDLQPSLTSALTQSLDDYNNGIIGPGHCDESTAVEEVSWGQVKGAYR